jgi:membrane protein implicated in regulation of membrane protease activity
LFRINLQILIIIWWIGAAVAASAFLFQSYELYVIVGTVGWIIVLTTTALIIYEIRKIKEEDKRKELAEK